MIYFPLFNATANRDTEIMLHVNMAAKTFTYSNILIQSFLSHVYVHYEVIEDTRLRGITLLPMRWSDVVWRWLLCRQLYTMCILRELSTAITVQVTSVRRWDRGTEAKQTELVRNGFITWCNCKKTENRVIVNVYLQELCFILLVMNLWCITVKVYGVCRFIVFVWGPYISDWDSETNCFTIIQLYYMLLWRLLNFTNQIHNVIRVWININTIHVMFYSLYYAVCNMSNRISTPKYWNVFSFL